MMRWKKGVLIAVLLLLCSLSAVTEAAAAGGGSGTLLQSPPADSHYERIEGASLSATTKLDLWHYSGGYWRVTNPGAGTIQVPDEQMGGGSELVVPATKATFALKLPEKVRAAVAAGKKVVPVIRSGSGVELSRLFELPGVFSMSGTELTFTAKPKFNLISTRKASFKYPFGIDIPVTVPFIERKFGYNMYSVFGNGYRAVQVNGYVDPAGAVSPAGTPAGWIHPSMIADSKGTIKPGYRLMINSKLMDSAGFSIGQGTFADAGALGLCFEYPVEFSFYVYNEDHVPVCEKCGRCELTSEGSCRADNCPNWDTPDCGCYQKPPEPEKNICGKCGMCELTAEGNCGEDSCPNWDTPDCGCYVPPDVEAEAVLSLPETTYEGHPVTASDQSKFRIDGEWFSAARAYHEGKARNSFSVVEPGAGKVSRDPDSRTRADVVFPKKGNYHVQLRITPKYGGSLYDTKPIEVRKTPTVLAVLGGTQKQNRKQVLNVRVATDPKSPLEQLFVELTHKETGETVHLIHDLQDPQRNVNHNTEIIKTRAIAGEGSDEYWTRCRLEFLTKNAAAEDFTYRVYARDKRGLWDEAAEDFTVQPDRPPKAEIEVGSGFLREMKENRAVIRAKDVSGTDGDQLQRVWSVANTASYDGISDRYEAQSEAASADPFSGSTFSGIESAPGYQDNSFGTKQSVQFDRTGVGKIRLKLDVKDVWTEETLPEYITEADYLTASAVAETEVRNTAPVVSMDVLWPKTGEALLLAGGEAEYEKLTEAAAELSTGLLENDTDAEVYIERIAPAPGGGTDGAYGVSAFAAVPYGYQGSGDTFWEKRAVLIDNTRLFQAEATWITGERPEDCYPSTPFRIHAYDAAGTGELAPVWSCTITSSLIGREDSGMEAAFYQDEEGVYLYFVVAGKTVVIDKATGAILTCLDMEMGAANSVGDEIYTYKPDGIYRVSMADGTCRKRVSISVFPMVRRISGRDHILVRRGTSLARGILEPQKGGGFSMEPFPQTDDDGTARYTLHGIDTEGKMIVSAVSAEAESSYNRRLVIRVYGADNTLLNEKVCRIDRRDVYSVAPVRDGAGRFHYCALARNAGGSNSYDRTFVSVWGIDTPFSAEVRLQNKHGDGYVTEAENVLLAEERENGKVYVMTGGYREYWDSIGGYPGSAQGRGEQAKLFCFDPGTGAAAECSLADSHLWSGLEPQMEYAVQSDVYTALTTADNALDHTAAESRTRILRRSREAEDILPRYLDRYFTGRKDASVLLIYDETNEADCRNADELAAAMQEKNISYLFAGSNTKTKYGSELAGAMGEKGRAVDAGNLCETLLKALAGKEETGRALQVKTTAADGSISRTYRLSPNTQYFYEYDYKRLPDAGSQESGKKENGKEESSKGEDGKEARGKEGAAADPFRFAAHYDRSIAGKGLLAEQYVVTDSFEENFNDPENLNPYFSGLDQAKTVGGRYDLAYFKGSFGSNKYREAAGSLSFAVPEGKQAVLSWDYDFCRDSAADWNMGYYVDGQLWNHTPAENIFKGHYTHTELLEAGTHTLEAKTGAYRRSIEIWGRLDNLRVDFVELRKADNDAEQENILISESSARPAGDWQHISGSFRTPGRAAAYTAAPTRYDRSDLSAEQGEFYSWKSKARGAKEIQFQFGDQPADYAAVGFSINSNSSKSVQCQIGKTVFQSSAKSEPQNAMASIRGSFSAVLRQQTGNVTGTIKHSAYNTPANGNFNSLEVAELTDSAARGLVEKNRFFLAPLANGQKSFFVENDVFGGAVTLRFAPGEAREYQLRDLKIYSIQNGVRVYAEDAALGERSTPVLWEADQAETAVVTVGKPEEEGSKLVYQKGELVAYNVVYHDYEGDPSKYGRWKYTHTPFNDGPHSLASVVLNTDGTVQAMPGGELSEPIRSFFVDGKYTVEHWQEDNTRRGAEPGGNPDYDKKSNVASLTFYVQGGGTAPWVTKIGTDPAAVKEKDRYRLKIGVDDAEKDELSLMTEIYFGGKLIDTHRKTGITADAAGRYPEITTDPVRLPAEVGTYEVVCTVRDRSGTGIKSYRFRVVTDNKVTGWVYHTDEWEQNRKQYNVRRFKTEYNEKSDPAAYKKQTPPRKRGTNVFWSGEKFMLRAAAGGEPSGVTCSIPGSSYSVRMKYTGRKNAEGERIYEGVLWDASMLHKWGRSVPEELTFRFKARYGDTTEKLCDVKVIVDQYDEYWQLHRFS